jgi:hypothetical protein
VTPRVQVLSGLLAGEARTPDEKVAALRQLVALAGTDAGGVRAALAAAAADPANAPILKHVARAYGLTGDRACLAELEPLLAHANKSVSCNALKSAIELDPAHAVRLAMRAITTGPEAAAWPLAFLLARSCEEASREFFLGLTYSERDRDRIAGLVYLRTRPPEESVPVILDLLLRERDKYVRAHASKLLTRRVRRSEAKVLHDIRADLAAKIAELEQVIARLPEELDPTWAGPAAGGGSMVLRRPAPAPEAAPVPAEPAAPPRVSQAVPAPPPGNAAPPPAPAEAARFATGPLAAALAVGLTFGGAAAVREWRQPDGRLDLSGPGAAAPLADLGFAPFGAVQTRLARGGAPERDFRLSDVLMPGDTVTTGGEGSLVLYSAKASVLSMGQGARIARGGEEKGEKGARVHLVRVERGPLELDWREANGLRLELAGGRLDAAKIHVIVKGEELAVRKGEGTWRPRTGPAETLAAGASIGIAKGR